MKDLKLHFLQTWFIYDSHQLEHHRHRSVVVIASTYAAHQNKHHCSMYQVGRTLISLNMYFTSFALWAWSGGGGGFVTRVHTPLKQEAHGTQYIHIAIYIYMMVYRILYILYTHSTAWKSCHFHKYENFILTARIHRVEFTLL